MQPRPLNSQLFQRSCLHCWKEPLPCLTWQSGVPQPLSGTTPCTRVCLLVATPSQLLPALRRCVPCTGPCQTSSAAAWGLVGPDVAQTAHNAAQLGSSSGLAAGWVLVPKKPQGPLQPGDGNKGIMVHRTQQLSSMSAMQDTNSQADTNRKPSFSQCLDSAPPGGVFSHSSGLRMKDGRLGQPHTCRWRLARHPAAAA